MSDSPVRHLSLQGASNFRDLGGYPTADGRTTRWRHIFRSNHLGQLTAADVEIVRALGVRSAFDFRGVEERTAGVCVVDEITVHSLPIEPTVVASLRAELARGTLTAPVALDIMRESYRNYVRHNTHSFRNLFGHLLEDRAPLVIHCTAGKDRTGFASALILHALGVPDDVIAEDYLLTNTYYKRDVSSAVGSARRRSQRDRLRRGLLSGGRFRGRRQRIWRSRNLLARRPQARHSRADRAQGALSAIVGGRSGETMMQGKVLIVTGALGALGKVVADMAQSRGARIAGIDHAPTQTPATAERIEIGSVDLSDAAQAKAAIEAAAKHFGQLDALINIAGGFAFETVGDGDITTWQRMYALNVLTALNTASAALPHLAAAKAGRIVNIGAMGALQAGAGMGPYAASKAGVHRLTEALANEWKGKVTVNAVLPSTIDTQANRTSMPKADFSKWVTPQELAEVILFLASDAASGVTGALIPVSGRV